MPGDTATGRPMAPIDPFAPAPRGVYQDGVVEVRATGRVRSRRRLHGVRTEHFDVFGQGDRIVVEHVLRPDQVGDDLAGLLADELFRPGWLRGPDLFQRIFTGVVRSVAEDPVVSWELFYRNTLRQIDGCLQGDAAVPSGIAAFAPVYAHGEALVRGSSVLELGCCFGFLSLRLAASGREVTASDLNPGTVAVLTGVAARLRIPLGTVVADATCYPGPDGMVDTVLAIHLLEHLDAADGAKVLAEATRLAGAVW